MAQVGYRGLYNKKATQPYRISRSKIELFTQCTLCFWLEAVKGIKRPSSPPFRINSAIDELFKKEFDVHRKAKTPHPIMKDNKVEAVPFEHEDLDAWRHNFTGVSALHEPSNLAVFGAIDDVWVKEDGELIVVDYKATAKASEVNIDSDWQITYKRQMEVYQWLLRQNGFTVSDTGYFVYTNGRLDLDGFDNRLEFTTKLIPYTGDDSWIEETLLNMKKCLDGELKPTVGVAVMGGSCEHCGYARSRAMLLPWQQLRKQQESDKK